MAATTVTQITSTLKGQLDKYGSVLGGRTGSKAALSTNKLGTILYDAQGAVNNHAGLLDATGAAIETFPLQDCKLQTLLQLAATAASGVFGLSAGTFGSASPVLVGETIAGDTKTDYTRFLWTAPADYVAASNVTLTIHARVSDTVSGAKTLDVEAYKSNKEAGIGSDICATAAQTLSSSAWANYAFTLTGTTLVAGDVLDIRLTGVLTGTQTGPYISIGDIQFGYTRKLAT